MSRIGKQIINLPTAVKLEQSANTVKVTGPKGEMSLGLPDGISLYINGPEIEVKTTGSGKNFSSQHGLIRSLLSNCIHGVSEGWIKILELNGVGYRANIQGSDLVLNLGFSHDITVKPLNSIKFEVKEGKIHVSGPDKQLVGKVAADIRRLKPPEPYKGKGIRYQGEYIRRKAGKAAKAVGGAK